ncbi:spermidine synthase [Sandarakinorhabdus limnophila]|jgi:spermidine synthase|uniref:spermidine synthase n=1 Tax=Sandarakinorhabdus limnophila TaxID=210512 RepID=UPI0037C94EFB
MIPRELIGEAEVPGGPPLRLFRRGSDFMIVLERNELMSTRMHGSEVALGTMACDRLAGHKAPHLLIGGYGMGYTLRAVLGQLGPGAHVTLVELVPGIIDWARGPMAAVTAGCLDDPRVTLTMGDVGASMAHSNAQYDAILLDVDNGPEGLTRAANDGLYSPQGLANAKQALRPGGILAVWSAAPDTAFGRQLERGGFSVETVKVRARETGKGATHIIWFATKR